MVDKTRSGRVTKAPASRAPPPSSKRGTAPKPKRPPPANINTRKSSFSFKGKAKRGPSTPRSARKPAEPAQEEAPPKVPRVYNEIWESGPASIAFSFKPSLTTDQDTTTMTLNLMDHIIKPENWNPSLSYNILSAACFYFASRIIGHEGNTPAVIAEAAEVEPDMVNAMAGGYDWVVREKLVRALSVGEGDVRRGYGILWEQREGLGEFVGEFAGVLQGLPGPEGVVQAAGPEVEASGFSVEAEKEEEVQAEAAIEPEKAPELEFDPFELDDFDMYVEENE